MDERARREKERYNSNTIKRGNYTRIFAGSSYSSQLLSDKITEKMKKGNGGNVLEIGSNAFIGYVVARGVKPSKLTCINISESELKLGTDFVEKNNVEFPIDFKIMDANNLNFEDNRFDLVFGGAILHHLNFEHAIQEIHRILKPDGAMMFHEPLAGNPVAKLIRILTPFARTKDERPLTRKDLEYVKKYFKTDYGFYQFFSVFSTMFFNLCGINDSNPLNKAIISLDVFISKNVPFLRPFFREIIVCGTKKAKE
jgi:ubiquinone/menaquinone biosynthesis C-methylase UbiE